MKYSRLIYLTFFVFFSHSAVSTDLLEQLTIYAEQDPPYNYLENGSPKGASVEIFKEIIKRLNDENHAPEFIFVPWARGFNETLTKPNTLLMSVARTPQREKLFQWVGPMNAMQGALIALQQHPISIHNYSQVGSFTFGVAHDDAGEELIRGQGITSENILYITSQHSAIQLLIRKRIDAWVWSAAGALWHIENLGFDVDQFKTIPVTDRLPHYYALSPNTDPQIVRSLQRALDSLIADGTSQEINKKYHALEAQ